MTELDFKSRVSIEDRKKKYKNLKHKECIPLILQPDPKSNLQRLQCEIFGVQPDYKIFDIKKYLKQQLTISATQGLFIYCNANVLNDDMGLYSIYEMYKDPQDQLLYLTYALQQAFG